MRDNLNATIISVINHHLAGQTVIQSYCQSLYNQSTMGSCAALVANLLT